MVRDYLNLYIIRSDRKEMLGEETGDGRAVLVRDKTHRDLCMSHRRKHCLCTFSGVTAPDTVHIQTWSDTGTLESGVACLTLDLLDVKELLVLLNIERSLGKLRPVLSRKLHHIIVEALDSDMTVLVNERRYHVAEDIYRICHGTAVMSRMEVLVRSCDLYLDI